MKFIIRQICHVIMIFIVSILHIIAWAFNKK